MSEPLDMSFAPPGSTERDFIDRLEALIRTLTAERDAKHAGEQQVRQTLWLNHGCSVVGLYGDDGEMQCNAMSCRIDFKREPLPAIMLKLFASGRLHAGELPTAALTPALRTLREQWQETIVRDEATVARRECGEEGYDPNYFRGLAHARKGCLRELETAARALLALVPEEPK